MSGRLQAKRTLITGASSGIGRATAHRFAAEGGSVAVGGRDVARVDRTVREITDQGGVAIPVVGDVGEPDSAAAVVEAAVSGLGGLDAVVNNAGIDATEWYPVDEWPVEDFDEIMR